MSAPHSCGDPCVFPKSLSLDNFVEEDINSVPPFTTGLKRNRWAWEVKEWKDTIAKCTLLSVLLLARSLLSHCPSSKKYPDLCWGRTSMSIIFMGVGFPPCSFYKTLSFTFCDISISPFRPFIFTGNTYQKSE